MDELPKTIFDISDVDVVERSRYDMSFKYFLGMSPEETALINPSSLCKFRKLRLKDKDMLNLLIGKTVSIAIEKGIIKSKTIIVDATHTGSRSNPYSPIEILQLRSKQLRKSLYDTDESIKNNIPTKNEDNNLEHELDYTKALAVLDRKRRISLQTRLLHTTLMLTNVGCAHGKKNVTKMEQKQNLTRSP